MKRDTILYFYPSLSSFVKKDIRIFSKEYTINKFSFNPVKKIHTPLVFIQQLLFLIINFRKCSMVICQFAGYHSFLPVFFTKIFSTPSLIISGGTDCVSFPSIKYGNLHKKILRLFTKQSFQWATHISPVHNSLMLCDYTYQDKDYPKQGISFFYPKIKTPHTIIFNGYNGNKWKKVKEKKKNLFITVAAGLHMSFSKQLKGIDLIIEIAKYFPDCEFMIIGADNKSTIEDLSPNIILVPIVANEHLTEYYSRAEFYLQLSMSEGFPNALCEAMLCECIPIVSNVGAMPEIISESGFILPRRDVILLRDIISKALLSDKEKLSASARENILKKYPEEKREQALLGLVKRMLNLQR